MTTKTYAIATANRLPVLGRTYTEWANREVAEEDFTNAAPNHVVVRLVEKTYRNGAFYSARILRSTAEADPLEARRGRALLLS